MNYLLLFTVIYLLSTQKPEADIWARPASIKPNKSSGYGH